MEDMNEFLKDAGIENMDELKNSCKETEPDESVEDQDQKKHAEKWEGRDNFENSPALSQEKDVVKINKDTHLGETFQTIQEEIDYLTERIGENINSSFETTD